MTWALVAAGALFWCLRLFVSAPPVPPSTPVAANGPVVHGDLSRLLGADLQPQVAAAAAEPAPDARFQLIGVVTPRAPSAAREGVALIAVDGKPAKAFRVGAVIDGQTVLKSVAARGAMLGPRDGAPQVTLNLAPPAAAAIGALPSLAPQGAESNPNPNPNPAAQPSPPSSVAAGKDRATTVRAMRSMLPPPAMPVDRAPPAMPVDRAPPPYPGAPTR